MVVLHEDNSNAQVTRIRFDNELFLEVREAEHWS